MVGGRRCSRCGQIKLFRDFHPTPKLRCGLSSHCHECKNLGTRRWRARNPGYEEAHNIRRRAPLARACQSCGEEFIRNRSGLNARCQRCVREDRAARARVQNTGRSRARRARLAEGDLTQAEVRGVLFSRSTCPGCGCRLTDKRGRRQRTIDHIVPLNQGGAHTLANIRLLCLGCNIDRPLDGSDVEQEALWARRTG